MLLKNIKLAGFKSFVDPTTIFIPSHLTAIVGPNGCGKSNIIDAVCWVMGENSTKVLRGEASTDVIFNGSTARKPVGQASVELVFDNNDGSLGGQYASYADISIKRVLSRDSESTYYLNGTRCRRRDIIDIFLGTGLGPRSYSIIGQNMISRIIEAKPDEMRVYLEEAAGISKYKERRRETETRIGHTKENLARVNDIRSELEKQLSSLNRQATAAEKFKQLKEEERHLRAEWYVIQWCNLDAKLVDCTLQLKQQETGLEAIQAELSSLDLNLENRRSDYRSASETFQEVQRRYYLIGTEITRIEQEIRHNEERLHQIKQDLEQLQLDRKNVNDDLLQIEEECHQLTREIEEINPLLQSSKQIQQEKEANVIQLETALQSWQEKWDGFNQKNAQLIQITQVEQTRINHLEKNIDSLKERENKLLEMQDSIHLNELMFVQEKLVEENLMCAKQLQNAQNDYAQSRNVIAIAQSKRHTLSDELNQLRSKRQQLQGEQSSLQALQETALGKRDQRLMQWLNKHKLDHLPRLAQGIEVQKGWEYAVEKVLGPYLQAVCVDNIKELFPNIRELEEGNLLLYSSQSNKTSAKLSNIPTLLSKVKTSYPIHTLLEAIYCVDTVEEAFKVSEKLNPNESVITPNGLWLGAEWLKADFDKNPESGIFERENELKKIGEHVLDLLVKEKNLENEIKKQEEELIELEKQCNIFQKNIHEFQSGLAELRASEKANQERLDELMKKEALLMKEQESLFLQLNQAQMEITEAREALSKAAQEVQEENKVTLLNERDQLKIKLQNDKAELSSIIQQVQQYEIRLQTAKSQYALSQQTIQRLNNQLATLKQREDSLTRESTMTETIDNLKELLSTTLNHRLILEEELQVNRATVEALEQEVRSVETKRQEVEKESHHYRDKLEAVRLEHQEGKIKIDTLLDHIKETHFELETILKELPEETDVNVWQAHLEQINQRITRLGPINLVAIEEFSTCSERKDYLDKQQADLQEGLTTLEEAISKIDKETRAKFKETFEKVNDCFKNLFPKIFGGGNAYLELLTDNLLDSGVSVMACPPGKRNSTIHLLSGGEKAMTAIALVFSIFHLNPAPFCLLDEVDAPLDDANIGRFCELVKAMAEKTQFLFISHNKLAIEMAEHLIGVTMNEPGVSRLVSVNMEEAIQMAGQ